MTTPDLSLVPGGVPPLPPPQQMQILLPQPLQEVMQQWPTVLTRLAACEAKPVSTAPVVWIACCAGLLGAGGMALLVWLWQFRDLLGVR